MRKTGFPDPDEPESGIRKLSIRHLSVGHKESIDTPYIVVGVLEAKLGGDKSRIII